MSAYRGVAREAMLGTAAGAPLAHGFAPAWPLDHLGELAAQALMRWQTRHLIREWGTIEGVTIIDDEPETSD